MSKISRTYALRIGLRILVVFWVMSIPLFVANTVIKLGTDSGSVWVIAGIVPLILIIMAGWGVFRLSATHTLTPSPIISWATFWLLGCVTVYIFYYFHYMFLKTAPFFVAAVGLNIPSNRMRVLWGLTIGSIGVLTLISQWGYDAEIMWYGKAAFYRTTPDYQLMMQNIDPRHHPAYPPLLTHLYELFDVFKSAKLVSFIFYAAMISAVYGLLEGRRLWVYIMASFPLWWYIIPAGLADVPLMAFLTMGVYWLERREAQLGAVLIALMPLVKQEGLLLAVCVVVSLGYARHWWSIGWVTGFTMLFSVTWYGIVLEEQPGGNDFSLTAFDLSNLPTIIYMCVGSLLDVFGFNFLWVVFLVTLPLMVRQKQTWLWIIPTLYMGGMAFSYLFSTYPTGFEEHIVDSYGRLLSQVAPLALVSLARVLDPIPKETAVSVTEPYLG